MPKRKKYSILERAEYHKKLKKKSKSPYVRARSSGFIDYLTEGRPNNVANFYDNADKLAYYEGRKRAEKTLKRWQNVKF